MRITLESGSFKSFEAPFVWDNIPKFAVLTGPNGSGKTQLLELISRAVQKGPPKPQNPIQQRFAANRPPVPKIFASVEIKDRELFFLQSGWDISNPTSVNHDAIRKALDELAEQVRKANTSDPKLLRLRKAVQEKVGRSIAELENKDVVAALPVDSLYSYETGHQRVLNDLVQVFEHYHLRRAALVLKERNISDDEVLKRIGEAPWHLVNRTFSAAGFPHRVIEPAIDDLDVLYEFRTVGVSGKAIEASALSTGEKTLLCLALRLLSAKEYKVHPKLMLMDEPDAHLHPGIIRGFFDGLRNVLVKEFDCRVIATTHRLDTIALLDQDELFEVFPTGLRVRPVTSISSAVARLSANLLSVLKNTRCVFVEDVADTEFYNLIRELLADDPNANLDPLPMFQAVSSGKGLTKVSGGCDVVMEWVRKMGDAGLGQLVCGLLDYDGHRIASGNIFVLPRYSIENYLFDPLVAYETLLNIGKSPDIAGVNLKAGDSSKISDLSEVLLQRIVDEIAKPILTKMSIAGGQTMDVSFTDGKTLKYPVAYRDVRGHDLQRYTNEVYPLVTTKGSIAAMRRLKMVQQELAGLFAALIGA